MNICGYQISWEQIAYRIQQFRSVCLPVIDEQLRREAVSLLPESWRTPFRQLPGSTLAHVLRLYKAIRDDPSLEAEERKSLILLALTHDLGKAITRPTLFERVVKVLLPLPNRSHVIAGAKLLKKLGAPATLVWQIRNHHDHSGNDPLLIKFQTFDDRL